MSTFHDFNLPKQLQNGIDDLGFDTPTPIQKQVYSIIRSGKDIVGVAQTGTGKTLAYMLPILSQHKYAPDTILKTLILVPTRELVVQTVERIDAFAKYLSIKTLGIYGGTNINTQRKALVEGADIIVATPGRLYDLVLSRDVQLKTIKKLVIDEVDVMLDLGFRFQLNNLFELLPERRQNIMFSATMTNDVSALIDGFFKAPIKVSIAVSGTPLDNIKQVCYNVRNFYTKVNLLAHLLRNEEEFQKVLVFVSTKRSADRVFEQLEEAYGTEMGIVHSNKSQNYRLNAIQQFDEGEKRILITTDVMSRGLDLKLITHVINIDTPNFPENYMHRIGRTGRAEEEGNSILFYTEKERWAKEKIEQLMDLKITEIEFPEEVEINPELTPQERPKQNSGYTQKGKVVVGNPGFHEKKEKNKKQNQGGSYKMKIKQKYKKPKTRGDKKQNERKRKR